MGFYEQIIFGVKKEMQKRLTVDEIKNFETVQDICDYLD